MTEEERVAARMRFFLRMDGLGIDYFPREVAYIDARRLMVMRDGRPALTEAGRRFLDQHPAQEWEARPWPSFSPAA
jgi:hypothetical protein